MCDHLIDSSYYICTECISECKDWLKRKNKSFKNEEELKAHFVKFITQKPRTSERHNEEQDWNVFDDFIKNIYSG